MVTVAAMLLPQWGGRPHADHRSPSLSLEASGKPEPLEDELFCGKLDSSESEFDNRASGSGPHFTYSDERTDHFYLP